MAMNTVQVRLTREQIKKLDKFIDIGHYPNRSEAVRDSVRKLIEKMENNN